MLWNSIDGATGPSHLASLLIQVTDGVTCRRRRVGMPGVIPRPEVAWPASDRAAGAIPDHGHRHRPIQMPAYAAKIDDSPLVRRCYSRAVCSAMHPPEDRRPCTEHSVPCAASEPSGKDCSNTERRFPDVVVVTVRNIGRNDVSSAPPALGAARRSMLAVNRGLSGGPERHPEIAGSHQRIGQPSRSARSSHAWVNPLTSAAHCARSRARVLRATGSTGHMVSLLACHAS
jgi:hypothetical protein